MGAAQVMRWEVPGAVSCKLGKSSPDLQLQFAIGSDQFEIRSIGGNQPRSCGSGAQCDQQVKVQIAKLFRTEAFIRADFAKQESRF